MRCFLKLCCLTFALIFSLTAQAQAKPDPQPEKKWNTGVFSGEQIDVVTMAEPKVRQPCKVQRVDEDAIICHGRHGAKAVTYKREDVLALIDPPTHSGLWWSLGEGALAVGGIVASLFVPITAVAVVMQVAGGITIWGALYDFGTSEDHGDDNILYQQPGVVLAVALHPRK